MRMGVNMALSGQHMDYVLSSDPDCVYDTILGALRGVIWYYNRENEMVKIKHSIEREMSVHRNEQDRQNVSMPNIANSSEQVEFIWMLIVQMFGDYGTSPRSGWIQYDRLDDALEFVNMLLGEER